MTINNVLLFVKRSFGIVLVLLVRAPVIVTCFVIITIAHVVSNQLYKLAGWWGKKLPGLDQFGWPNLKSK